MLCNDVLSECSIHTTVFMIVVVIVGIQLYYHLHLSENSSNRFTGGGAERPTGLTE
jgi:heme/copper-type cytochrome/quinol oxidase subunit 4